MRHFEPIAALRITSLAVDRSRACSRCGIALGECRPSTRHCADCDVTIRFEDALDAAGVDILQIPDDLLEDVAERGPDGQRKFWARQRKKAKRNAERGVAA